MPDFQLKAETILPAALPLNPAASSCPADDAAKRDLMAVMKRGEATTPARGQAERSLHGKRGSKATSESWVVVPSQDASTHVEPSPSPPPAEAPEPKRPKFNFGIFQPKAPMASADHAPGPPPATSAKTSFGLPGAAARAQEQDQANHHDPPSSRWPSTFGFKSSSSSSTSSSSVPALFDHRAKKDRSKFSAGPLKPQWGAIAGMDAQGEQGYILPFLMMTRRHLVSDQNQGAMNPGGHVFRTAGEQLVEDYMNSRCQMNVANCTKIDIYFCFLSTHR